MFGLNAIITIQTLTVNTTDGDVAESWSDGECRRAEVVQIDGTRYLKEDELVDRAIYRIKTWDNCYSDNIRIVYNTLTLYPIRPITRNRGTGSKLNEIVILAATKK